MTIKHNEKRILDWVVVIPIVAIGLVYIFSTLFFKDNLLYATSITLIIVTVTFFLLIKIKEAIESYDKELKESQMALCEKAMYDELTKLANRSLFKDKCISEIYRAKREDHLIAILFIDLDGFKTINDTFGHNIGDELLIQVANRISSQVRKTDTLARFGGDEFVLMLVNCKSETNVTHIAEKIKNSISKPFDLANEEVMVGCSIGISMYPNDGQDYDELLRNADIAMYKAKESGKNRVVFFNKNMYSKIIEFQKMENSIRKGLENDEFILYYQPQVYTHNNEIAGFEALIRWKKGDEIVTPGVFLPVAVQSDLIVEIGEMVMIKAMSFAKKLHDLGYKFGKISINIDNRQLQKGNLLEIIQDALNKTGCNESLIECEITEGFIMKDIESSISLLQSLRKVGINIAMDDFGTGHSSLSYIKQLPIDTLKIDRTFVKDIPHSEKDIAIIKTIVALGKGLGVRVLAEGVETEEQKQFMVNNFYPIIQGYYYGKPLPEEKVIDFIKDFQNKHK
ncbi:putative bifunctional diguanylate cyclase/phosphodiesterase [Hydrogenimonas thermophila]|uniref:Diguanylate cyclase (GGDEF) domain-containing protein n=1 Tax=Hydrogenimonas thermophila TaxID=223786 RepID=A0A1I5R2G4_9BACT|nr:EAL domain-containing protein [Hydrogenimonas thermophila]SFP52692.1 diguanylate cyclase (GGDEF) domain-containing protein [Hydrogenimonas thermophila]